MNEERIRRLEEKIAYLERHVTAQDKAMLELGDELTRVRREVKRLREQRAPGANAGAGEAAADFPADERPPHY